MEWNWRQGNFTTTGRILFYNIWKKIVEKVSMCRKNEQEDPWWRDMERREGKQCRWTTRGFPVKRTRGDPKGINHLSDETSWGSEQECIVWNNLNIGFWQELKYIKIWLANVEISFGESRFLLVCIGSLEKKIPNIHISLWNPIFSRDPPRTKFCRVPVARDDGGDFSFF